MSALHFVLPMLVTHNEKFQYQTRIPCCSWMKSLQIIENFPVWWLHRNSTEPSGCSLGVILDLCSCLWKPALVRVLGVGLCLYERCVEPTPNMQGPTRRKILARGHILVALWDGFTQEYGVGDPSPQGSWEEGTEEDEPDISKENAFTRNVSWHELTDSWPNISRHGPLVGLNLRIY